MNNEQKELLKRDLCARLPYGVKVVFDNGNPAHKTCDMTLYGIDIWLGQVSTGNGNFIYDIEYIKPYLRPMSSMTDSEKEYFFGLTEMKCTLGYAIDKVRFCLEHHLDMNKLIPKGIALEAPKGMYE